MADALPAALFVHSVLVNADVWRNVIWTWLTGGAASLPICPAHGATPVPDAGAADLSLDGLAGMLDQLCERLGLDQVDVWRTTAVVRWRRSSRPVVPSASAR